MQDWGKPRRPNREVRERSGPAPRDPRADSDRPAAPEEAPLVSGRPPSRPRTDAIGRIAALEAEIERMKSERAHDADQMGEMLVRVATVERTRAAAENRAVAAELQAGDLRAELAQLKARCAQLEAEAWEAQESSRQLPVDPDAARDTAARVASIIDELERREEMAAGLRARTLEQIRQALADIDAPKTPPGT